MLQIGIDGAAELAARLNALPDGLRSALMEKMGALAQDLYGQIVDVNLSGAVLNSRSGELRESIQLEIASQDARFDAQIYSNGDAPYAAILEYGGKTAAHEILPDKAKALAFVFNGKQIFARRIQHPGSQIAPHSYLRSALDEQGTEILSSLQQTIVGIAEQVKEGP